MFKRRPLVWAALLLIAIMLCMEAAGVPAPCEREMTRELHGKKRQGESLQGKRLQGKNLEEQDVQGETLQGETLQGETLQNILSDSRQAAELVVTGRVEYIEGSGENARIRLTDLTVADAKVRFRIYVYPDGAFPEWVHAGNYVRVVGKARCAEAPTCPGEFDMRDYYRSRNILFALQKATVTGYAGPWSVAGVLERISGALSEGMYRILPKKDAQTAAAIILGQRREMDDGEAQLYREGGIAHILAISGLHINLLAMGLYDQLRKRRLSFLTSSVIASVIVFLFCMMTGMSISSQRAMIMFMIWCLSQVLGRTPDTLCALAAASIVIFLRYPYALTDAGFLLSFGCLLSLETFAPWISERLKKMHVPGIVRLNLSAGLSVQLGTLPVMCRYFYQITPWSVLVNLIVLPLIPVLMAAGLLGSIAGMLFPGLGIYTGAPCHYVLRIFEAVCWFEKKLPYSVIVTGCPPLWQCAVYYLLIGLMVIGIRRKKWQRYRSTTALIPLAAVCLLLTRENPGVRVIFTDVGQGDGILIRSGYRNYLVDCGSSTVKSVWRYRVEPMLKYYGIGKLDAVFVTHADSDHICGLEEMLTTYERNLIGQNSGGVTVGAFAIPRAACDLGKLKAVAQMHRIPLLSPSSGWILKDRQSRIEVLLPSEQAISTDRNENSLVLMLESGRKKVLLTGDLESGGEEELIRIYGDRLRADVLKCGHHGSANATGNELLDLVKPSVAVISCGIHNRYHHPAPSVLKRLRARGIRVRRTDKSGTIILVLS